MLDSFEAASYNNDKLSLTLHRTASFLVLSDFPEVCLFVQILKQCQYIQMHI